MNHYETLPVARQLAVTHCLSAFNRVQIAWGAGVGQDGPLPAQLLAALLPLGDARQDLVALHDGLLRSLELRALAQEVRVRAADLRGCETFPAEAGRT